ncbi:MAG: SpoIIE family protein phosphatase [Acidobacteriota bacterium]|nr:SpoIIE family protein phosphatase [Acidobacteriota bacterium]
MRRLTLLILLALTSCAGLPAQTFSLVTAREPVVALDGLWRFHTGDNPAWAGVNFDDSEWPLLRSDQDWGKQGYLGLKGLAWYRFKVVLPGDSGPLSLLLPRIVTNYEVYANGVWIGGCGAMPPHPEGRFCTPGIFELPPGIQSSSPTVTIALRVWQQASWSTYTGGGPYGTSYLGATPLLRARLQSGLDAYIHSAIQDYVLVLLETLGGLVSLALFLFRRREREYLWFGCMMLLEAGMGAYDIHRALYGAEIRAYYRWSRGLSDLAFYAAVAFYFRLLRGRRSWLLYVALIGLILGTASNLLFSLPHARDYVRVPVIASFEFLARFPYIVWVLTLLLRRAKERLADARLLLAPVLLLYVNSLVRSIILVSFQFGWQHRFSRQAFTVLSQPFPVNSDSLASFLFLIAMLAILVNRFARTRRDEERYASEIEAARIIQQVLIPDATSAVPGFQIESVYKPAGEVGGDFFQIVPTGSGGVLIVVGDVSGKGMPAAMTVSLLVGTFRTLTNYTQNPGSILAGMNQQMLARSQGGFTTCLVLRAGLDGMLTMANAGHIPPYLNGKELALENGLPLGLSAESAYAECTYSLDCHARLTLLTDGVVEATNGKRELFGFERAERIIHQSAAAIADAAQRWGQEDDITVLTVARTTPEIA